MSDDTAFDHWDRNQWGEVDIDIEKVGGTNSPSFPRSKIICPIDLPLLESGVESELNKCLSCTQKNCAGFNGMAPSPKKGATYIYRKP